MGAYRTSPFTRDRRRHFAVRLTSDWVVLASTFGSETINNCRLLDPERNRVPADEIDHPLWNGIFHGLEQPRRKR